MKKKIILCMGLMAISGLCGMKRKELGSSSSLPVLKTRKTKVVEDHRLAIPRVPRFLDLDKKGVMGSQTFAEMLADKKSNPYGIDVVEILTDDPKTNKSVCLYVEASELRAHMYGGTDRTRTPLSRYTLQRHLLFPLCVKDMTTPLKRQSLSVVIPKDGYSGLLSVVVRDLGGKSSEDLARKRQYCEEIAHQEEDISARFTALLLLGEMHWTGEVVSENPEEGLIKAHKCFNLTAHQECNKRARDQARLILGEMLWTGEVVSENPEDDLDVARHYFELVIAAEGNKVVRDQAEEKLATMDNESE